jgi:Leucine-rich repeat (LRR) protein
LPDGLLQSLDSLKSLEDLILSGLEVKSLPDIFEQFSSLQFLNLSQCSTLQQLPPSFFELQSLKGLDLSFCSGIEEITESFGGLYSLTSLNLSGCSSLRILPKSFGELIHLEELNLSYCTALAELPISFRSLERLHVLKLHRCVHLIEQVKNLTNSLEHLELTSCKDINLQSNFFSYLTRLRVLDLSNCSQMEIVIGTPANLEVLILANAALPLDLNFLTQFQNLQKLDITDAVLSTANAALSNLQNVFTCMPMLKTVETNNLDIYSILPSRIKISKVMDSLTGVGSSNVRDTENTDGRSTPSGTNLQTIFNGSYAYA